jgi:hypothetical protein
VTPETSSSASTAFRNVQGPAAFWLPLLALFTGARQAELAGLTEHEFVGRALFRAIRMPPFRYRSTRGIPPRLAALDAVGRVAVQPFQIILGVADQHACFCGLTYSLRAKRRRCGNLIDAGRDFIARNVCVQCAGLADRIALALAGSGLHSRYRFSALQNSEVRLRCKGAAILVFEIELRL